MYALFPSLQLFPTNESRLSLFLSLFMTLYYKKRGRLPTKTLCVFIFGGFTKMLAFFQRKRV